MSNAIDLYVSQKLPIRTIEEALTGPVPVQIHGVYPSHFPTFAVERGFGACERVNFSHKVNVSPFNRQRPEFFWCSKPDGKKNLMVAVIPGRDYVAHYATLVRHLAHKLTPNPDAMVQVFRYPFAESTIASWTNLSPELIQLNDIVLIGHVWELKDLFSQSCELVDSRDTEFYGTFRFQISPNEHITLLGVKYCFWGSIAAEISFHLCELKAKEILYVAKLGALSSPGDIYTRIFSPSKYYILNYDTVTHNVEGPPNGILKCYPSLDTGPHISVPTVLEEDYVQRKLATQLHAQSIDNEISQIAKAVALSNAINGTRVSFSTLHFATDYLRRANEKHLPTPFDLSSNRRDEARKRKSEIIHRIWNDYLWPYLSRRW
jgi:hypothetical protein